MNENADDLELDPIPSFYFPFLNWQSVKSFEKTQLIE